jgi:hypothetical protein
LTNFSLSILTLFLLSITEARDFQGKGKSLIQGQSTDTITTVQKIVQNYWIRLGKSI